jgi:hypothetical protein
MSWLRIIAAFAFALAFVCQPAAASAFVPASSEARVGAFEVVPGMLVGGLGDASRGQHHGIGAAYDENASGYRFAARGIPRAGSLSNEATRAWYKARLGEIPSRLDQSLPLRERALQAFKLRNEIKLQARELMADRAAAASLPAPRSLADVVGRAYESGARGDDVWRYVLRGSGKSDAAVDAALGL